MELVKFKMGREDRCLTLCYRNNEIYNSYPYVNSFVCRKECQYFKGVKDKIYVKCSFKEDNK